MHELPRRGAAPRHGRARARSCSRILKRESWQIISNPRQPQFNDEGAVPVGVPGVIVLLPLPDLQLELSLYEGHATTKRPELADPKVSRPYVSASLNRSRILAFVSVSFCLRLVRESLTTSVRPNVLINVTSMKTVRAESPKHQYEVHPTRPRRTWWKKPSLSGWGFCWLSRETHNRCRLCVCVCVCVCVRVCVCVWVCNISYIYIRHYTYDFVQTCIYMRLDTEIYIHIHTTWYLCLIFLDTHGETVTVVCLLQELMWTHSWVSGRSHTQTWCWGRVCRRTTFCHRTTDFSHYTLHPDIFFPTRFVF
jgi:hypothetical protein